MFFLGFASIFSGFFLVDLIIGSGTDFFIFNFNTLMHNSIDFHIGNLHINLLGLYYSIFGLSWIITILNKTNHHLIIKLLQPTKILNSSIRRIKINLKVLFDFFSYRWYINFIYNTVLALPTLRISYNFVFLILDQGYITYLLGQMYVSKVVNKYAAYVLT